MLVPGRVYHLYLSKCCYPQKMLTLIYSFSILLGTLFRCDFWGSVLGYIQMKIIENHWFWHTTLWETAWNNMKYLSLGWVFLHLQSWKTRGINNEERMVGNWATSGGATCNGTAERAWDAGSEGRSPHFKIPSCSGGTWRCPSWNGRWVTRWCCVYVCLYCMIGLYCIFYFLYCILFHCILVHCIVLHCIVLYCKVLQCM